MKKIALLLTAATSLVTSASFSQQSENSALEALQAIPGEYQNAVVKLSGTGASPNPEKWEALAYADEIGDAPRNIVISAGEVISDSLSAKVGTMLSHQTGIVVGNVLVDSPEVFEIARNASASQGSEMASADLVLTQPGEGASPVWSVVCRGASGQTLGHMSVSAENGAVLSQKF